MDDRNRTCLKLTKNFPFCIIISNLGNFPVFLILLLAIQTGLTSVFPLSYLILSCFVFNT